MRIHGSISARLSGQRFTRCGAFSLLEVLFAVGIMAVAMVGLMQGLTTALHGNKDSELQTSASLFAAGLIETLRAEGALIDGTTEGPCGSGLGQCEWEQVIAPANLDGLHEVTIVVRHASSRKTICELKTLLFEIPTDLAPASTPGKDSQKAPGNRKR